MSTPEFVAEVARRGLARGRKITNRELAAACRRSESWVSTRLHRPSVPPELVAALERVAPEADCAGGVVAR
ncbi:MAG: hypothetical protein GF320_15365 [Armatimonadia bacterium]|nr:hypothetical protein [Armatimonadia bacterium]